METSSPSNSEAGNIVAACNFRDEQTTVWMRHRDVTMPRCCACCLTEENLLDEPLALAGRADRVPFPICPICRHHSKIDSAAIGVSLLIGVVGPPLIYWLLVGTGFFGRLRGLGLLLVLYLVAALLLTGAV
ncbi:MAG: hypothetical protein HY736_24310, partial [Verrucomicrobia bacterium]|nr:hypothetical protein [Verrucomicrobiota bacterium]